MAKTAETLGKPLLPWQRRVADVALEIAPETGTFAYREVIVTVERQQGKSTLTLGIETDRCLFWPEPQRVMYSAQTGKDARSKLLEDHVPVIQQSPLAKAIKTVRRARGEEAVYWRNGSMIEVMASTGSAGHGRTLDLGVIDEAFDDEDDRREQAMLPAMVTRDDAQLWVVSTAGTSRSLYLRRKVETGRHAAEADSGHGVAFFEWSIPDDEDHTDPAVWWQYMPALGYTISEQAIQHALSTMSDAEFRRAFGNQWTEQEHDLPIPVPVWERVCEPEVKPQGRLMFGMDALADRSAGSIAVFGSGVGELVEHRPNVSWMRDRLTDLCKKHSAAVVFDKGGALGDVAADLGRAGVEVHGLSNPEYAAACGRMYDSVADERIRVRADTRLDATIEGLSKRPYGDRFMWNRSSPTDVTPFIALTLALHMDGDVESVYEDRGLVSL